MPTKYSKVAVAVLFAPAISYASEGEHHHEHDEKKIEKIQVTASRLGRIVTESATRTEVISGEEVQEKALMRPGNISMLVAETGGVRVQNTSPALGSANIRLQSLYGRYTHFRYDFKSLHNIFTVELTINEIIKPTTSLVRGFSLYL